MLSSDSMFFDEQALWGGLTMLNCKFDCELLLANCCPSPRAAFGQKGTLEREKYIFF